ncbi:SDR family oxidoreductase [Candidatus Micrarchaeota archaeon]|nr:SDR family oxidoreductase [Candidatus Micrarchaeota archaeon]
MKILITGGAGFIGSHMCERLASEGHEVVCIDSLITGDKKNVENLNIESLNQDIRKPFDIKADLVINLACPASPIDYQKYPIETLETNSIGMKNVLGNAIKYKMRVLHASTSEVYGDPLKHPQSEDYWGNVNPNGPRSCYDEGKRFAESFCMNYNKKYKIDIIMARIFNTYGPRMRSNDGRVIPNFINQALRNEPITIYGNGKQTRSFCYISDMVDGLIRLAFSDIKFDIFNIGNPNETKLTELAEIVKKLCASDSKITFKPLPQDDPVKRKPDITKITKTTNWMPKVSLEEGLLKTINYFKDVGDKKYGR